MSSYGTTTANGPSSNTEQAKAKAQEKAQEGAQQAKRTVRDQVDQRSTQAGQRVGSTASDIRTVGDELRNQGKEQPAKLADQAAQRVESLGNYLEHSDGDKILRDVEDFGRRQPWAVIAGGLALGFAASRFLKASSSRRYETSTSNYPNYSRGLTTGAPTSRTGLSAGDAGSYGTTPGVPPVGAETGFRDNPRMTGGDLPPQSPGRGLYTEPGERGA
jgi:hypothetical protein